MNVPAATGLAAAGAVAAGGGAAVDGSALDGAGPAGRSDGAVGAAATDGAAGAAIGATAASVSCSFADGGGNTKGKRKKPSATPNPVPITPPSRKITSPRQNRRMRILPRRTLYSRPGAVAFTSPSGLFTFDF